MVKYKKFIPPNFRFTASKGGTCDNLITKNHLKFAEVVFSVEEAKQKGLEIDHDDSLCYDSSDSFGLLIHGTQMPNSAAGRAVMKLRKQGIGGYGESKISRNTVIEKPLRIYVNMFSVNKRT
jgi:hypothetical protein